MDSRAKYNFPERGKAIATNFHTTLISNSSLPDGLYDTNGNIVKSIKIDKKYHEVDIECFPEIKVPELPYVGKLDVKSILNQIKVAKNYVGEEENIGAHLIRLENGELIATNRYSLVKFETDNKLEVPLSIPMNAIKVLKKVLTEEKVGYVEFYSKEDMLKIVSANYTIITKLVNLPFIDYKELIDRLNPKVTVKINRVQLLNNLKRHKVVNSFTENGRYSSIFTISNYEMDIYSVNPSTELKTSIECETDGDIKINLNTKYLLNFLKGLKCENVQLKFIDARSAVQVIPENENGFLLTMPLAIREVD